LFASTKRGLALVFDLDFVAAGLAARADGRGIEPFAINSKPRTEVKTKGCRVETKQRLAVTKAMANGRRGDE
jgi:hypothetical protein